MSISVSTGWPSVHEPVPQLGPASHDPAGGSRRSSEDQGTLACGLTESNKCRAGLGDVVVGRAMLEVFDDQTVGVA
jgi:hypothetical protein